MSPKYRLACQCHMKYILTTDSYSFILSAVYIRMRATLTRRDSAPLLGCTYSRDPFLSCTSVPINGRLHHRASPNLHLIIMHLSATLACTSGSCTSVPLSPAPQAHLSMHLSAIMTLYDLLPSVCLATRHACRLINLQNSIRMTTTMTAKGILPPLRLACLLGLPAHRACLLPSIMPSGNTRLSSLPRASCPPATCS